MQRQKEEQAMALQLATDAEESAQDSETASAEAQTVEPEAALAGDAKEAVSGESSPAESAEVYVHICGAVNVPGVYAVPADSRLFEVVALAGGLAAEADETSLNLAHTVADGQQIVVLTREETAALAERGLYPAETADVASGGAQGSGLVNINTASVAELTAISGIGESRAQAIVAYREQNGGFRTIEDIKRVDGIKDGLFSKIKDKITV
ncbi:MAG: ComEA family DNA-binding protein [Roseburia sp.]|nr:ComEA family DNA-binding protein [Roseburia sp.]